MIDWWLNATSLKYKTPHAISLAVKTLIRLCFDLFLILWWRFPSECSVLSTGGDQLIHFPPTLFDKQTCPQQTFLISSPFAPHTPLNLFLNQKCLEPHADNVFYLQESFFGGMWAFCSENDQKQSPILGKCSPGARSAHILPANPPIAHSVFFGGELKCRRICENKHFHISTSHWISIWRPQICMSGLPLSSFFKALSKTINIYTKCCKDHVAMFL